MTDNPVPENTADAAKSAGPAAAPAASLPADPAVDPVRDMADLRAATDRLLRRAEALDDAALRGPSLLPGWTRGHVLAHLARNADALVNVFAGRPMYASADARDADIERDAPRPLAAQLADLRATAARLDDAADALSPDGWRARCELRNGVVDVKARLPFRRLVEVELHHVDLGAGYALEDLPEAFVLREIAFLAERFSGHPDVPALTLAAPDGRTWTTGARTGAPIQVSGAAHALVGWLAGRTDGTGVRADRPGDTDGVALPVLPPL